MRDVQSDFEAWAEVSVLLLGQPAETSGAILWQRGLTEIWPQADGHWTDVLCEDMANGRLERIDRYGELCAHELWQSHPAVDFRQAVMRGDGEAVSASQPEASDGQPRADFVAQMAPPLPAPQPPLLHQQETAGPDLAALSRFLKAAREASSWPVQRYALYWAQLEGHPERAEQIHAEHGLDKPEVRRHVVDVWNERFERDPELHARW